MATQIVINDPASQRHVPAPATMLVSTDADNALRTGTDGNLYVKKEEEKDLVSKQQGNYLRYGTDKGVYLDGNDVLSNGRQNLLHTSDRDGRVELLEEDLDALKLGGPSSDKNNLLVEGNDGKAMLQPKVINHMIDDKVEPLKADVEKAKKDAADALDATKNIEVVSSDRKNIITAGSDKGAYLSAEDIVDVVKDAGIDKVDVRELINPGSDPLLNVQGDKLVSGLSVQYNEATGRLDILGVNGQSVAHTNIPTAVALLEDVRIEENPSGQVPGTYIHFMFRLTDGSVSNVWLNVNKLAEFHTAGDGITISDDGKINIDTERLKEMINAAIADGSIVLVSKDTDNLIKPGTDGGAKLTNDDIAASVNNALFTGAVTVVSGDANNVIVKGSDKGALLTGDKIIEAVGENIKDLAIEAIEQAIKDGDVKIVSQDADNKLSAGSDGGAFLGAESITDTVTDAIEDGTIKLVSEDEDNLVKAGADGGVFVDKNDLPPSGPSDDSGNVLVQGSDGKLYYKPVTDYGELL